MNCLKKIIKNKYVCEFLGIAILILIVILATGILSSGFAFVSGNKMVILVLLILIILIMGV